jgi:hypothetical protein
LHQGGQFSNCNTQALLTVPIIAHSWHHFHTSGYVDDNFETEDSYS